MLTLLHDSASSEPISALQHSAPPSELPLIMGPSASSPAPRPAVSLSRFKRNFRTFTGGALDGLTDSSDWANIVVAGGSVLASLEGSSDRDGYANADVDIFLYGMSDEQARAKIMHIWRKVVAASKKGTKCLRTPNTITFVPPLPAKHIQVILHIAKDPFEILSGFDVDACALLFDGQHVFALDRCIRAISSRVNLIDLNLRSWSYETRLIKYARRGFAIGAPGFQRERADVGSFWSDDHPEGYDYEEATGLKKLLLAEWARDEMGLYTCTDRTRFLKAEGPAQVAAFVRSIGDEYGPSAPCLPYEQANSPESFLQGKKRASFVFGPMPKGTFDVTNSDWIGTIYVPSKSGENETAKKKGKEGKKRGHGGWMDRGEF